MNRWIICLAGTAINICLGVLYSWSIFVVPLIDKYGAEAGFSRASLTWPFTASIFTFALVMVYAGRLQDRIGPRIVCTIGAAIMGAGFILTSFAGSVPAIILTYGVIGGAGVAFGYVTPVVTTIKWFPDMKGLTVGITVAGFGFGAFVFTPIAVKLIKSVGISSAFLYLGLIFLIAVGLLAQLLQIPPAGYRPEGWTPPPPKPGGVKAARDYTPGEAVKTATFWTLWLAFLGNAGVGLMVISLIAPYAKSLGMSPETAAFMIGFLSIANGFGRIIAGWLSDVMGRTRAMILIFGITTVTIFLLPFIAGTTLGFATGLMIAGAAYGSNFALFPAATAEYFGTKNLGVNYAAVFTAWGVAGVVGPRVKAYMLASRTAGLERGTPEFTQAALGAYKTAFMVGTGLGLLAVVMAIVTKPPKEVAPAAATGR
ncbi:MAG: OFA family MFS transporter [Candidatus Methylomirabilales bacterium]